MNKDDIKRAALRRFAAQGYHSTSLRELAGDLGVTAAAFYYHFPNKDALLHEIITSNLRGDIEDLKRVRENSDHPLDDLIAFHVVGCCVNQDEVRVLNRESEFLPDELRGEIRELVRAYREEFYGPVTDEYDIDGPDLEIAVRALLSLGTFAVYWYDPNGPMTPEEVAERFRTYARGMLDAADRAERTEALAKPPPAVALLDGVAAVDDQELAGDEVGGRRGKKDGGAD